MLALAMAGCGSNAQQGSGGDAGAVGQSAQKTITDCAGRQVAVPAQIDKVAEIHPMAAQSLVRLAGIDKFVAVDQVFSKIYLSDTATPYYTDEQRAALNALPVTAPFMKGADEEQLLSLKPDVIFTLTSDQKADQLQSDLGIPVVCVAKAPSDKAADSFRVVGQVMDNEQIGDQMADWWANTSSRIEADGAKAADGDKPTVMYVGKAGDIMAVPGKDSVYGTTIAEAGCKSVSDDLEEATNEAIDVTMEQMMNWNPDVIVCQTADEKDKIMSDPAWSALRAVKAGKVYVPLQYTGFDGWFSVLGSDWLNATVLHAGDASAQARLEQDMKDFYHLFYERDLTDAELAAVAQTW